LINVLASETPWSSNEHISDLFCWIVPFCLQCHQTCFDVCWLVVF
jgi:hypothetical protein